MEGTAAQASACRAEPVCAVRKRRQPRGRSAAAPSVRPAPAATRTRAPSLPKAWRPAASTHPGLQVPPPALPPRPEAGVCRQGEWAEAGAQTSCNPPWDAQGAQGAWAGRKRAVFPGRRGSPDSSFGMHEYISLLMTMEKQKTEKESPAQARFGWRSYRARLGFRGSWQGRERVGEREAPGLIPELTVAPTSDHPGRGAAVQERGVATARSRPGAC